MLNLKELRKRKGWTQSQVAEKLGVTYQAYGHYENGRRNPDIESLKKLAEIFDVSIGCLLGEYPLLDIIKNNYVKEDKSRHNASTTELNSFLSMIEHTDSSKQEKIINTIKSAFPEIFEFPNGYKEGTGFVNSTSAREYYYSKVIYSAASDGTEPDDEEIIELANDIFEEEKKEKKKQ